MKRFTAAAALAGIFVAGSLALAATAEAASLGGSSADQAVNDLRARGYNVQLNLNSTRDVPLSECTVTGVSGLPKNLPVGSSAPATQFTTVYVDVNCPPDN
jgi:hypothetical protein